MSPSRYRAEKAYKNLDFINSPDARAIRILSEYLEPATRFREFKIKDTVVFFGSARVPSPEESEAALAAAKESGEGVAEAERGAEMVKYYEATRELARRLTEWSKSLESSGRRFVVCSGGGPGIMEAANRGASEAAGENIGLNISLPFEQSENPYITHRLSLEFHYFFLRKFWFNYLAKAIVVMPGGFGTMDEFMETVTLVQTLKVKRALPLVLFGTEYWSRVIDFDPMIEFGTISAEDVDLFFKTDSVDEAYDYLVKELSEHFLNDEDDEDDEDD